MDSRHYWQENGGPVKYENYNSADYGRQSEGNLNFASGGGGAALPGEDDADYLNYLKKGKVSRQQDPMSHRIIEKRRRDRMNNCLANLSRLIPPDYCKKGRGRVEKTEIIEMAIRHLKYLQGRSDHQPEGPISLENFRLGYQECRSEVMRYLVEAKGYPPTDSLCLHLIGHLNRHCDNIMKGDTLNHPRSNPDTTSTSSGGSGLFGPDKTPAPPAHPFHKRDYTTPHFLQTDPHDDFIALPFYDEETPLPLTRPPPPTLRNVRKEREDFTDHAHSYKFKNTIKQRFSQDCDEAHDMTTAKRSRSDDSNSQAPSHSSTDEGVCRDASPERERTLADEPRESPCHLAQETPPKTTKACIPVFALNASGKFYIPMSVSYDSISPYGGASEVIQAPETIPPLHPVTINVNFQPRRDASRQTEGPGETTRKWRPT